MNQEAKMHIATLLTHADPDVRRRAAEELRDVPALASIAALSAALRDDDKGVRDASSRSLCEIGGVNVARGVVEYIADENIVTRNLAAEILLHLGKVTIPVLLPYVEHADQNVRKFAVDILGLLHAEKAVPEIVSRLDDPDENVAVSAVEALGNIGHPGSIQHLIRVYQAHDYTKAAVAEALGKIGDPSSGGFLLEMLRANLKEKAADRLVAFTIIEALGRVGDGDALIALQQLAQEVHGRLRRMVIHASVQIADRLGESVSALPGCKHDCIEALQDDDITICYSAAKSLLTCADEDVMRAFVYSLGRFEELDTLIMPVMVQHAESFPLAVKALEDPATRGRKEIIGLLGKLALRFVWEIMDDEVAVPDEGVLDHAIVVVAGEWSVANEETRAAIVDTLFRMDGDRAVQFLDNVRNDPDPWLRIHVVELLASIEDRRVPGFIETFLSDEDDMVREMAANVLVAKGYLPSEEASDRCHQVREGEE